MKLSKADTFDSDFEQSYDNITWLASRICDMPIALISLLDDKRQWFKSNYGLSFRETPIEYSFCKHACSEKENDGLDIYSVSDARLSKLFCKNPLVTGEMANIVFYAGMPIQLKDQSVVGTVCVIDNKERELDEYQKKSLRILSGQVANLIELRILRMQQMES